MWVQVPPGVRARDALGSSKFVVSANTNAVGDAMTGSGSTNEILELRGNADKHDLADTGLKYQAANHLVCEGLRAGAQIATHDRHRLSSQLGVCVCGLDRQGDGGSPAADQSGESNLDHGRNRRTTPRHDPHDVPDTTRPTSARSRVPIGTYSDAVTENAPTPLLSETDNRYEFGGLAIIKRATGEPEDQKQFTRDEIDMPGYVESVERSYEGTAWRTLRLWNTPGPTT